MNLPENVFQIADSTLLLPGEEVGKRPAEPNDHGGIEQEESCETYINLFGGREDFQNCLVSIFMYGLKRSTTPPGDRMNKNQVIRELHHINDCFLGVQRHKSAH